jgi:glycosyltransferase involved in cell wall biosynthesis
MKKIVLMPVKNEDWILEYSLSCASLWADYIIVADQNSTDRTPEICKNFDKVIYIKNDSQFHSGAVRRLLLEEARKIP